MVRSWGKMHSPREIAFSRERRRVLDELGPYFSSLLESCPLPDRQFEGHIETADGAPPSTESIVGQTLVLTARLIDRDGCQREIALRLGHDQHWKTLICVCTREGEQHVIAQGDGTEAIAAARELIRAAFATLAC